ncbi:hypothetical protein GCM10009107_14480 [Ideonella azotifigens]|uniref:DUF3667 domain-containing protein n=1 Tax=Ideonella azotifigens TaxID=513160 RepID=A0ABN1JU22_9BURK
MNPPPHPIALVTTSQPLPASLSQLHHGHARSPHCRNCEQDLTPLPDADYCPRCGQETVLHPPSFTEFVHEFITHYVALEGALWRTLRMLLTRPGQLTREYFHGKRRHFVLPLRLYLTASFVFFLVMKLTGGDGRHIIVGSHLPATAASAPAAANSAASSASSASADASEPEVELDDDSVLATIDDKDLQREQRCLKESDACSAIDHFVARMTHKASAAHPEGMSHQFAAKAPYAVFLMLPFFAALMKLAYLGRKRSYGEHFVFSLHVHSFWFIALLCIQVLPNAVMVLPLLAIPVYGALSMKRVYGGSWWATLPRALLISLAYSLLLALVTGGLALWLLMVG